MRENKVRGYAVEEVVNSQWIYGTGIHVTKFTDEYAKEKGKKEECFVFTDSGWVEVHKESVGQYAELKDIKFKPFYKGDIIEIGYGNNHKWKEEVIFHRGCFMAGDENLLVNVMHDATIIGNKFEHPELLGSST